MSITINPVETTDTTNSALMELQELGAIVSRQENYIQLDLMRLYTLGFQLVYVNGMACFIENSNLDQSINMVPYTCPIIPMKSLSTYTFIKTKHIIKSEIYFYIVLFLGV